MEVRCGGASVAFPGRHQAGREVLDSGKGLHMRQWHCTAGGQQYGPIPEETLRQWIRENRVTRNDRVWTEGMTDWDLLPNVPEFDDLLAGPAAPGVLPAPGYAPPAQGAYVKPHRGGAVLALGILGIIPCFICGIVAWVLANADLKEMRAGKMDPAGEGLTNAGRICGIVGVCVFSAYILFYILMFGAMFSTISTLR